MSEDWKLEEHGCLNCGKKVKVVRIEPYKGKEHPRGLWLNSLDGECVIGVLCWDCASKLCDDGFIGICGGGGFQPDAFISKDFPIKHPEFLLEEEEYEEDW